MSYLANKHIKVANLPLVPEVPIPKEIYDVDPKRLIGLTNSPEKLNTIRVERLKSMGLPSVASYANVERILEELDYSEKVMSGLGCPVINVANKAIGETRSQCPGFAAFHVLSRRFESKIGRAHV